MVRKWSENGRNEVGIRSENGRNEVGMGSEYGRNMVGIDLKINIFFQLGFRSE